MRLASLAERNPRRPRDRRARPWTGWLAAALPLLVLAACAGAQTPRPRPREVPSRFADPPLPAPPLEVPPAKRVYPPPTEPRAVASGVLARFELDAPETSPFVLHGTVPLPRGVFPPEDGRSPFAVVSHGPDRTLVPAQVEIVSRYPTGEADVVEILARVELGGTDGPGRRVYFDLVEAPDDLNAPEFALHESVARLFEPDESAPFLLRSTDVFGNVYVFDLRGRPGGAGVGAARVLADGPAARRLRHSGALVPRHESGKGEPLPHLMGVQAYFTQWSGRDALSLDLRIHNGCTSGSREPTEIELPVGMIYWRSLELVVPPEWAVVPLVRDPFLGKPSEEDGHTVVPLVRRLPGGKLHLMGPQAQFQRRLTLVPRESVDGLKAHLALEGLAFCSAGRGLWSWFSAETGRYLPQRSVLATWEQFEKGPLRGAQGLRVQLASERDLLRNALHSGKSNHYLIPASVMGWAHPWFHKDQGVAGGVDILTFEGHRTAAAASTAGYERLLLLHRMNACRQPEAAWNAEGEPVGYHQWLDGEGRVPFDYRTNARMAPTIFRLPMKGGPPASKQVQVVHARELRPPYDQGTPHRPNGEVPFRDDVLLAWLPHDGQHMIRYTKNTKAIVWLGNDSLARDDLVQSGEVFHLMFHEGPHIAESWSAGVTLSVFEAQAAERPHQGAYIGRDAAWGIDAMCAAYSVASPEWRARNFEWFRRVARLFETIAMPNGLLQRKDHPTLIGHDRYDAAQTYQCLFLLHAMRAMNVSVFEGIDDELRPMLEDLLRRSLDYLYWKPIWACFPSSYQPADASEPLLECGPRWSFAVGLKDGGKEPPFCDEERWGEAYMPEDGLYGGTENFHCWWALEYGMLASEETDGTGLNNRYLRRTLDSWIRPGDYPDLVRRLFVDTRDASSDNSGNWAGFVGRLQSLGVP